MLSSSEMSDASRSRDASLISVPLIPVVMFFAFSQGGDFGFMMWLGPIMAFLLAFGISADISYDNTAFALHLTTGVSGLADRAGRVLACAVFALPVTLVFAVVPFFWLGSWELLPGVLGLSLGTLLTGFGLSSVVSARYTYNVPLPGESPFKTPPGSTARMMIVQMGGMAVQLAEQTAHRQKLPDPRRMDVNAQVTECADYSR